MSATKLFPLFLLVAACSKSNPYYCEGNPDDNCELDARRTVDGLMTCTESSQCNDSTRPVCDDTSGTCVACDGDERGGCAGVTPVCSTTNECRGCTTNDECPSQACMPDGSCTDAAKVLYVATTGTTTTCTATEKCSMDHAVSLADGTRRTIVLDPGMYTTNGALAITKELTLLGRAAQIVRGGAGTGPVIAVGTGGNLTVAYVRISNGNDPTTGHGIACTSGTVVARNVTIFGNDGNGINASGCTVTIDRSSIYDNDTGGILVQGTTTPFTITNNWIYLNGDTATSYFGGVRIAVPTPTSSKLEFNTIVDNSAFVDTANTGGVYCTNFSPANNIIARNFVGTSASDTNSQVLGSCTHQSSKVQSTVEDLAFVHPSQPYDLRIGATSVAKDAATTSSTVAVDFEGDIRPQHGGKDIGADEYK